ncbi:LacI family DNA-binding transcriptional regulator [Gandjariella thermophila]|uniref:LacI family DNA-binding transcriptional regulator n=1 Tax=Gandjariella thermophila TaxID=1931992 RepID=UPI001CEF8C53|nr:LacI family DNA-binding transcriptional regulator [Gandjariella thermophila]
MPTLDEVARLAGVSRSTASRVINGQSYVSARARAAVTEAVTRLGYRPNMLARSLATRRTNSLALVVSEHGSRVLDDPFFARLLRGVYAGLAGTGLQLVLLMDQDGQDHAALGRYLCAGHVDGTLVVSLHGEDPLPGQLRSAGVPTVLVGRPLSTVDLPYVDADNFNGAVAAARHLAAAGRGTLVTIAGPRDMAVGIDRLAGWRCGMAAAGRRTAGVAHGDFTVEGGAAAMTRLLADHPDLDGVFAASDLMALGAMRALRAAGRTVPDDVAVVGFDDSDLAATAVPPLTTVRQPVEELGRTATWRLLGELDAEDQLPPSVLLPTELVARASG